VTPSDVVASFEKDKIFFFNIKSAGFDNNLLLPDADKKVGDPIEMPEFNEELQKWVVLPGVEEL
jgi:hypothetical protein